MRGWWAFSLAVSSLGCSVLYEPPAARQCQADSDCEGQAALAGLICDAELGVCVEPPPAASEACKSSALCTQQNSNQAALCRYAGSSCVRIETAECRQVTGNWQAPNALILGSIGPHTFRFADDSVAEADHNQRLIQALELAAEEWQQAVPSGLPQSRRPLAIVHCDSEGDALRAQRIMDHLVNEVQVPLLFALTDTELGATVNQAVDSGTAVVCVECHERAAQLAAAGHLVWRMLPPLAHQAQLAAWRVHDLELRIRAERGIAASMPLRVALLSDGFASRGEFAAEFRDIVLFNGNLGSVANGSSYLEWSAPDPRIEIANPLALARRVVEFAPDILVVAMDEAFPNYYLRLLEQEWRAPLPRPHYVATLLNQELGPFESAVAGDEDLRRRISGTGLFESPAVANNRQGFQTRFRSRFALDPGRTQTGYDAFYATALALFASDLDGQLNGEHVTDMFTRLMSGALTNIEPSALGSARAYLAAGDPINLVGASSELDWDPMTHQIRSDMGLWCLTRDEDQQLQLKNDAGPRWTPGGTTGSYDCQ